MLKSEEVNLFFTIAATKKNIKPGSLYTFKRGEEFDWKKIEHNIEVLIGNSDLEDLREEFDELEEKFDELEEEHKSLHQEFDGLEESYSDLQKERDVLGDEYSELAEELAQLKIDYQILLQDKDNSDLE